ncbi:hypothetical protein SRHO_G00013670 [Serrasalmus rhombeus]
MSSLAVSVPKYPAVTYSVRIRPTFSLKTAVNLVCRLHLNGLNPNRQHSETSLRLAVNCVNTSSCLLFHTIEDQ